jgi:carbon-monoxide dehydrogenase medium subunit
VGPRGERTIEAAQFFTGIMSTALGDDEILSTIVVPAVPGQGSAYVKFAHPASRYAVVGAAAAITLKAGVCSAVAAALGGLLPHAKRLASVERALTGQAPSDANVTAAADEWIAVDLGTEITGDLYASAEYRAAVAPVYVRRALAAAAARASQS